MPWNVFCKSEQKLTKPEPFKAFFKMSAAENDKKQNRNF